MVLADTGMGGAPRRTSTMRLTRMALALERKRQIGLMFPVISSEKRREYVPVGSTAASMPPTISPEKTEISSSKRHCAQPREAAQERVKTAISPPAPSATRR
jgi:hypothetical protein